MLTALSSDTRPAALAAGLLVIGVFAGALATATPAYAQSVDAETASRLARGAVSPSGADPVSRFGRDLSNAEAGALLREIGELAGGAAEAARSAARGETVAEVKAGTERVFQTVWGHPSGLVGGGAAEAASLGWKERWQVTGAEFDTAFVARLGTQPPQITDPRSLGIAGRGRAVRGRLKKIANGGTGASATERSAAEAAVASLNNVIGWTYITTGLKGREVQPRISLTHVWDAPPAFWNSTADTGWLFEVQAQAINILKTAYGNDVEEARRHAADLATLIDRVITGVDANNNGRIESIVMEGGLDAALAEGARAGLGGLQATADSSGGGSR